MKKLLIQLIGGLFINVIAHSQQLSPSLIAGAGGIGKAQGITLDWTLGEMAIESVATSDRLYTQGFHQPLLLVKKFYLTEPAELTGYKVSIAPNPVQSFLRVTYSIPQAKDITLTLTDFTGRSFNTQRTGEENGFLQVDMSGLIPGAYLLQVRTTEGKLLQSFKIIKGQ